MKVFTINSGSSSLKYSVYDGEREVTSGKLSSDAMEPREQSITQLIDKLRSAGHMDQVAAVGYRVVHGGPRHIDPERVTPELRADLESLTELAPDHMPDQLAVIDLVTRALPDLPAVACFDTAFHRDMPRVAQLYGLTRELADAGVIRYGFHGLSYSFLVEELRREGRLPERLIIAHLGNGSSMAAILNGQSIDTSMGLTPTGGFTMSSRSGDLDPGVVLHLIRQRGMTPDQVNRLVTKEGGLKGLSGTSSDMQKLVAASANDPRAAEAVEVYCYQARKFLGAFAAALGGLDLVVFAGGIGENSPEVRERISKGLTALGNPPVRVMKTNEEVMIARGTAAVLSASSSG